MNDQLISFDTAKLAKKKGFSVKGLLNYDLKGKLASTSEYTQSFDTDKFYLPLKRQARGLGYLAPTQASLQKWLREEHDIIVVAVPYTCSKNGISPTYIWMIYKRTASTRYENLYETYEEALEKGLQKALKLIK